MNTLPGSCYNPREVRFKSLFRTLAKVSKGAKETDNGIVTTDGGVFCFYPNIACIACNIRVVSIQMH